MTYFAEITSGNATIYSEAFSDSQPLKNRRAAIEKIKSLIEYFKSPQLELDLSKFDFVQAIQSVSGQPVLEMTRKTLIDEYCYSVYFLDERYPNFPMIIESSHWTEERLDRCRAIEYARYLEEGYDLGGEPEEVYITDDDIYLPILAANSENRIGLKQLLSRG